MVFNLPIFTKFIADKYFVDIRFTELHPNRRKTVENRAKFHRRCCVKHVFHSTDCHSIHRRSTALHWPSSASNFAHTVTEVWTVRAEIKLCLKVKYCCHSASCRHTFCTELLYWTSWKSFKRLQVTDRQTDGLTWSPHKTFLLLRKERRNVTSLLFTFMWYGPTGIGSHTHTHTSYETAVCGTQLVKIRFQHSWTVRSKCCVHMTFLLLPSP